MTLKNRHLRTIAQLCWAICSQQRHVSTIGQKNLLNSSISPTCPHNMVNFGPLAAEIGSLVWGTSANSNGFRVLTSLLPRRRSAEANQTLHDVWPSPGLVHYIFRGFCPVTEILQGANVTLRPTTLVCVLLYWQRYCTVLEQWASITLGIGPHSSY